MIYELLDFRILFVILIVLCVVYVHILIHFLLYAYILIFDPQMCLLFRCKIITVKFHPEKVGPGDYAFNREEKGENINFTLEK